MKVRLRRILTFVFVFAVAFSICQISYMSKASAATSPKLSKSSVTLTGKGTTVTLTVKNKPTGATYTWSSASKKIAKVDSSGLVTAVKKGTTYITCKITYQDGTYMNLRCKVTVKVPATAVTINNATLVKNAHQISVGDTYDFNRTLTPSGSSDKTYWVISDTDYATVDSNGVVTALQAGTVTLQARTAATKAKALDDTNTVTDAIILNIVEPTASVTSVTLTSEKVVTIVFSDAMESSSLITSGNTLSANVTIERKTVNSKTAASLGTVTASLSSDGLTLTLTATNAWDGVYNFTLESDIATQSGISFEGYDEDEDFTDSTAPTIQSVAVDDTGYIMEITFSKEVNIDSLAVAIPSTTSIQYLTQYVVTTVSNYTLSSDAKTVSIDLSGIDSTDKNTAFAITLSGIMDTKGNYTSPYYNTVTFYTDTTTKSNATLSYVERTGKYEITAHFTKSIQTAGTMTLGGVTVSGTVDTSDRKLVHYTIGETVAAYTTSKSGTIAGWYSYNSTYTTATSTTFTVDMSVGMTAPTLVSTSYSTVVSSSTLVTTVTLTYSKAVSLLTQSGSFSAVFTDSSSNVESRTIAYTATVSDKVVTLVLDSTYMTSVGTYTITIPEYFVYDNYSNYNAATTFVVAISTTSSLSLPAPTAVVQSTSNPSIFYVTFANKVDLSTALTTTNYAIDTVNPYSVEALSNSDSGATLQLTFSSGTIQYDGIYPVTIENIKGYNSSYTVMDDYYTLLTLSENVVPTLTSAKLSGTVITLTFSEAIQGTASFTVVQNGTTVTLSTASGCYISGSCVYINLATTVTTSSLYVLPTSSCAITDTNGNSAVLASQISVS